VKVLIARTDRLGDLVLSLPVYAYVKSRHPGWTVHALVAPAAVPLVENDPHVDAIWSGGGEAVGREDLAELEARLAAEKFDAAVLLLYRRELASLLRRIGVPRRIGPLSKWSSFYLLNRGVWQARSRSGRHEWAYNLQLAEKLAGKGGSWTEPRLHLDPAQRALSRSFRREFRIADERVVFVHPGSGGSALDWEPGSFGAVASLLAEEPRVRVFVTGSHHDRLTIDGLARHLAAEVEVIAERYPLREFLGVLAAGDLMIAPSTGPLHMAAALGLATVGLFAPAPTMSPRRWGNLGRAARSLVPPVTCPARRVCTGEACPLYNCLRGIGVEQVVAVARELLAARADPETRNDAGADRIEGGKR
jgi:ADP-heptose:LPS heptosyltransferase